MSAEAWEWRNSSLVGMTEGAVRLRRCGGSGAEEDVLRQHRRSSPLPPAGRRVRLRRRRPTPSLTLKQKPAKRIVRTATRTAVLDFCY